MKTEEIREMSRHEIEKSLAGLEEEIFNLRFQQATGEKGSAGKQRRLRRDIARIKTILRERELSEGKATG